MAYKILAALVSDPANNNIGMATAVACTLASAGTVTLEDGAGNEVGTINLAAGTHKIVKDKAQTLTFTGKATKIAHTD